MLKKLLLSSIAVMSVIAVDNKEPNWREDRVLLITGANMLYDQQLGINYQPVDLAQENSYRLRMFFKEYREIEAAKDKRNQAKIDKAIKDFKNKLYNISEFYGIIEGNLKILQGEPDMNGLSLGYMKNAIKFAYSSNNAQYKDTMHTVINEVIRPNLALLKDMFYHRNDNTYDAYILSPIATKYNSHIMNCRRKKAYSIIYCATK